MITSFGNITRRTDGLKDVTIREFSGGWNVVDSDLNLSSKYSKVMQNVYRASDGAITVRYGSRLFADLATKSGRLINGAYYNNYAVVVDELGQVFAINARGQSFTIFDNDIAAMLPGSPNGWSKTAFASLDVFKGKLVICNGVDKPLVVTTNLQCSYLVDEGTISNINTPIGRYVKAHNRYLIIGEGAVLNIGSADTVGTFFGDPAPNDGVVFDLSGYVIGGSISMTGLGAYRDRLIVTFPECSVILSLGTYSGTTHEPFVDDVIEQQGAISHRSIQSLGADMLYCDLTGVPSVSRALFTGSIQPSRVSSLVDPAIQSAINKVTTTASLEDYIFSAYDRIKGQYMLFVPNNNDVEKRSETVGFVYTKQDELKVKSWHEVRGWNWQFGFRTSEGRMIFGRDKQLFVLGSDSDPIYQDFVNYEEGFSDDTVFTDNRGFSPTADNKSGLPISFVWEQPWADFGHRMNNKATKYISLDTIGNARFTVNMFIDNVYEDVSDAGELFTDGTDFTDGTGFIRVNPILNPALSMEFVGGSVRGFGAGPFGSGPFGGGRISNEPRLYQWPAKFQLSKLRVEGSTTEALKLISVTLLYTQGSVRR